MQQPPLRPLPLPLAERKIAPLPPTLPSPLRVLWAQRWHVRSRHDSCYTGCHAIAKLGASSGAFSTSAIKQHIHTLDYKAWGRP